MDELTAGLVRARVGLEGDVCRVALAGELDISSAAAVEACVADTLPPEGTLEFDLAALTFMDSSGLAMMVGFLERARAVRVRHASPVVRRIIEATGLAGVLELAE